METFGTQLRLDLQEAEGAERSQPPMTATCISIVNAVIGIGVEEEDRKRTWKVCSLYHLFHDTDLFCEPD